MADKYASKARRARRNNALIRACVGKRGYQNRGEAETNIPTEQHAYYCRRCGLWHRGTDPDAKLIQRIRTVPRQRRVG